MFAGNDVAEGSAGALSILRPAKSSLISNSTFDANSAMASTIYAQPCGHNGGGGGGAACILVQDFPVTVANCSFTNNNATNGGKQLWTGRPVGQCRVHVQRCTLSNNVHFVLRA